MVTSNAASGYVAKISMLRLKSGWVPDGPNPDGVRKGRNAGWAGWGIPDGSRMASNCPVCQTGTRDNGITG